MKDHNEGSYKTVPQETGNAKWQKKSCKIFTWSMALMKLATILGIARWP
jgi:predicted lipoprotein with Yx(FWY)xxD motif